MFNQSLTIEDIMKAKKVLEKVNVPMVDFISTTTGLYSFQFAPLQAAAPCQMAECNKGNSPKKQGNNPMYVDNDKHIESSKINYLTDRTQTIYCQKASGLCATFGFQSSTAPETTQGLIDAFVTGKFKIKDDSKKDTKGYFHRPWENILFIDPSIKEDQAGLDVAEKALRVVYQDTIDTVSIGTPAEGLAAVKTLDAWTPTVGTA